MRNPHAPGAAVLSDDLETARDVTADAFARALSRWDVQTMANPTDWTSAVPEAGCPAR